MTGSDAPHPADHLIRELIDHPRAATDEEILLIIDQIATAPFNTDMQRVLRTERGQTYQAITLGDRADSLTLHLFRRVIGDRQWAAGTTAAAFVQSLRRAVRHPSIRLILYRHWGERNVVAVIVRTTDILDSEEMGPNAEPNLLILYLANRGILISGYQFSTMDTIRIPGDAIWLR